METKFPGSRSGRRRFLQLQCVTCHSGDSQARAPNLEGVYNRPVRLQDGSTVLADENYLRESILNPRAKVVAGYEPIMPTFQGIKEEELLEVLAFVKALRPGGTPQRNEDSTAPQSDPKAKDLKISNGVFLEAKRFAREDLSGKPIQPSSELTADPRVAVMRKPGAITKKP